MSETFTLVAQTDPADAMLKTNSGRVLSGWADDGFGEEVVGTMDEITDVAVQLRSLGCGSYADTVFGAFNGERVIEIEL